MVLLSGFASNWMRLSSRNFSSIELPRFYATPIFYVNSVPHIGHLYTAVYADALHRFTRLCYPDSVTIFSTGTDEHGLKIQKSAQSKNVDLVTYCDQVSAKFRQLFQDASISYTHFIRTTDDEHKKVVKNLWKILMEKGFIYKSKYCGYYSINDEAFVPENLIKTNSDGEKISIETGHKLEWHEEENYVFRLSQLQEQVTDWIDNRLIMRPQNFHTALKADIRNIKNFKDISISRSKSRLHWGIEIPDDNSQLIYVWFDALTNYLTVSGYPNHTIWPPCHIIGKDIIKFHCIYWPAFLIAAGLQPPNLVYCHSHWLYDRQKMSKSLGNVVDPFDCIERFTADGIRYFLLKEGTPHSDSNFNLDAVKTCLNAELADTFGNLLNRCTSNKLNPKQYYPRISLDEMIEILPESVDTINYIQNLSKECFQAYSDGNFHIGITHVMTGLRLVNSLFNIIRPWEFAKNSQDKINQKRLECLLFLSLESIRIAAILLKPIIPNISTLIFHKLNIQHEFCVWKSAEINAQQLYDDDHKISTEKLIIFSKLI
ncbi:methionine-tRNA ligase, mitochondrial-like protein [Euroglyphus maynei]|uniref:Methionine--tRNA ligase, mitochondrial n=1 Tax=Euroglyphus maynei TaxID=6958 RepID=A0A1Y3AWZ9_EURMA|nr:methionine-tRNA ligase, mitochondrial-like protein [Euroglyphus maynei]